MKTTKKLFIGVKVIIFVFAVLTCASAYAEQLIRVNENAKDLNRALKRVYYCRLAVQNFLDATKQSRQMSVSKANDASDNIEQMLQEEQLFRAIDFKEYLSYLERNSESLAEMESLNNAIKSSTFYSFIYVYDRGHRLSKYFREKYRVKVYFTSERNAFDGFLVGLFLAAIIHMVVWGLRLMLESFIGVNIKSAFSKALFRIFVGLEIAVIIYYMLVF